MAAIDKIYVSNWKEYQQFKEWCEQQPALEDKYGRKVAITSYLYKYDEPWLDFHPIFNAPCYVDAYIIRNCPFDFIQKELMVNYGHWSQETINKAYKCVTNRTKENKDFYTWLTEDDFVIVDGVITMPDSINSSYMKIKRGELYNSPRTSLSYDIGKHFRVTRHPAIKYNIPYGKVYWVDITLPEGMPYMWYSKDTNTWDFSDEFVESSWSSSCATCKSIKALKRLLIKWKLPVGTKVRAYDRTTDEYTFIITK